MNETIFLTGGSGFLGTLLASRLCRMQDVKVYVLVRAERESEACHRLKRVWHHDKTLYDSIGDRVIPVCGDFTKQGLGLCEEDRRVIEDTVGLLIHTGAEIDFSRSRSELFRTNQAGTRNMVAFAKNIRKLRRFVHLSTAYVAGQKKGLVREDDPPGTVFSSFYEESKADAEALVRASGLPFSICRPGMIVGDSETGWARTFNTIYYIVKLLLLGKMPLFPISADTLVNIVPGDYVADSVLKISFAKEAAGKTFHLTCPQEWCPPVGQLVEYAMDWAKKNLCVTISRPVFASLPMLNLAGLKHNQKPGRKKKTGIGNLLTLMPYFFGDQVFDRTNTDAICGPYDKDWHDYADRVLAFACRKNFMRQTGQTVFEQACSRRESRRYPVSYYDISSDGIRTVTGPEANKQIYRIYNALWAWGIRNGDRVALTGINSVDYMTLEQAIGLLGAVSVPIYYTTPASETTILLKKSGAKWFFIGDKRMAKQLAEIETSARIVVFSAGQEIEYPVEDRRRDETEHGEAHEKGHEEDRKTEYGEDQKTGSREDHELEHGEDQKTESREDHEVEHREALKTEYGEDQKTERTAGDKGTAAVMSWEDFLLRSSRKAPRQYPDPDDLATIRYTSGTTGEPKGVMFRYSQLAWMGETLVDLVSWKDRNDCIRYLSFLPLSHVVEGILALYAPYYALCKVDYYFLNDFGSLTDALPQVRPTIFFSVPRFYEKIWDQVTSNKMGKAWLSMKDGPAREMLAGLIRRKVLRKAGIDCCKQLIVGSAPASEALLDGFRALGIEIHNAYGQTEAPLITINRLGDNIIPTVGTPLPETKVWAKEDGELIVTGPQVSPGYYGLETDSIRDGVLWTGDLGLIHDNGHISLKGRKKDFIVTSYGKNISITKLEEKLKDLPGVSEAVLIVENRPYCTALIWMEEETSGSGDLLAERIAQMNEGLSNPEKIRRYRVISRPLSIQAGELTPNLKVKRANVEAGLADVIEEMYR